MGELSILAHTGALKFNWEPNDPNQIAEAKKCFQRFMEKNYSAFLVDNTGGEGKKIQIFDASANKIIMIPTLGGG